MIVMIAIKLIINMNEKLEQFSLSLPWSLSAFVACMTIGFKLIFVSLLVLFSSLFLFKSEDEDAEDDDDVVDAKLKSSNEVSTYRAVGFIGAGI